MGQPKPPKIPDPSVSYEKGMELDLKYLPRFLQAESEARRMYDPERIFEQLVLQDRFGPTMYRQQLDALGMLDPESRQVRQAMAERILGDLRSGYGLPSDFERQLTAQLRGAQAARGNILGPSAISAEGALKGRAAMDLYQQRLANAGNFLSSPTPIQQLSMVQGVQPDRTMAYVNRNAGLQGMAMAQQNYQNALAQYQMSGGGRNPWAGALSGAATGAVTGAGVAPPWGAIIGAIGGGLGGYFSDLRVKTGIIRKMRLGPIWVHEYGYKGLAGRWRGVIADELQKAVPRAVTRSKWGLLVVSGLFKPVRVR